MADGKPVRHRCGYVLVAWILTDLAGKRVVCYRDPPPRDLVVYQCPRCGEVLQLWWDVPPAVGEAGAR